MTNPFADHFSHGAAQYASYRPTYPPALFDWLAERAPDGGRAWDCGTGSGQAAVPLALRFDQVVASDPSYSQLAHAQHAEHVHYAAMTAESSALETGSVQLVTVAQALHWFDHLRFYAEAKRVLVGGGVIAVWTYGLLSVDRDVDALVHEFYHNEVGPYWPAERALVDAGYSTISFPFRELPVREFRMTAQWTFEQFIGYVNTWSAVSRYRQAHGINPVDRLADALRPVWKAATVREVRWPLEVRVGVT